MNHPLNVLRQHVTGAIERGEAVAIVEQPVTAGLPKTLTLSSYGYGNYVQLVDDAGKESVQVRYRKDYNCGALAQRIATAYSDPAAFFLDHCEQRAVVALQRGDVKELEFWQRLKGNVRKAQTLS